MTAEVAGREPQGPKTTVDRFVEVGLAAYGRGEVDDALVAWEQALALDPNDTRALGYVDYVRQHYELVSGSTAPVPEEDLGVPFGIGEDVGDYEVEVTTPRLPGADSPTVRLSSPPILDALDEGWSLEDDVMSRAHTVESPGLTLEMEADEPPDFEDRTSEYPKAQRTKAPSSPGFLPAEHPTTDPAAEEFAALEATTGIGQRALGFVQPKEAQPKEPRPPEPKARASRPELRVTFRDPTAPPTDGNHGDGDTLGDPDPLPEPPSLAPAPSAGPDDDDPDGLGPPLGEEVLPVPSKTTTLDFGSSEGPTRDLGLRSKDNDERSAAARITAALARDLRADTVKDDPALARTRTQEAKARILAEVDRAAPVGENPDQRTRRRIIALIILAQGAAKSLQLERAVLAIDAAFAEDPDSALAHKLIQQNREAIFGVFHDYLGDLDRRPRLSRALHDVLDEPLDSRAAFLLSRVDGSLTFEELLDVSGMPRLEAGRYLCQLVMRGLLAAE